MAQESILQSKIIKALEADGWIVVKTITLSKSGFPDIFAFRNKETIFIEVKAPNGVASALQRHRIRQLREEGFRAEFVNSMELFFQLFK
jgi:Holliday junction resolvase